VPYRAGTQLPDAPEAYEAMVTRPEAAPAQSRSTDLDSISTAQSNEPPEQCGNFPPRQGTSS
jgi:hypothetical protein